MNPIEAPAPIIPFNQAPCVIANNNDFYVIYGLGNATKNVVAATIYDGTWRNATINYGSTFPALMANGKIKALLVGSNVYFVYQVSATQVCISVITGSESMSFCTNYTAGFSIGDFCLYTDGNYLHLITNESGLLKSQRLNGNTLDSKFQINYTAGVSPNAPLANTNSSISAKFDQQLLHCVYNAATGLVDAFQLAANQWTFCTVVQGATDYKSFELFHLDSIFLLNMVGQLGSIDVMQSISSAPYWTDAYMSPTGLPASATAAQVGQNQFGVFISYTDTQGLLQCLYSFDGANWFYVQIGGPGAGASFAPNAPKALSAPGVGVYNNWAYNVCYVTTNNQVYDVFWAGGWNLVQLWPTPPSSDTNFMELKNTESPMMP